MTRQKERRKCLFSPTIWPKCHPRQYDNTGTAQDSAKRYSLIDISRADTASGFCFSVRGAARQSAVRKLTWKKPAENSTAATC